VPTELIEISDKLSEIYKLQMALLDDLYSYQREHHPAIPTIVPILLDAAIQWGEAYATYSQILIPVLRSPDALGQHGDTSVNLHCFLASPFNHVRGILRHVKTLLDATADHHTDIEPIKALIQSLSILIKDSYGAFGGRKVDENVESLKDLLSWNRGTPPVRLSKA
jgi:hypothetical protein